MFRINYRVLLYNSLIILFIFFIDRLSKIYIINLVKKENVLDIYLTPYLNLYLIWNKGVAFGLLSFDENYVYSFITVLIVIIVIIILIMLINSKGIKKYFLLAIIGGALGNLFDRIYYSAVPDFIDFHINDFHWFIFNIADIFITIGVIGLIFDEIFYNINKNEKN
jgi:signal peptidase II